MDVKDYPKLTPRESDVLSLIWVGQKNSEIAKTMDISKRTVEAHRFNISRKWNVTNVAGLLKIALFVKAIKVPKGGLNGRKVS